jgi:hypothetical protein
VRAVRFVAFVEEGVGCACVGRGGGVATGSESEFGIYSN